MTLLQKKVFPSHTKYRSRKSGCLVLPKDSKAQEGLEEAFPSPPLPATPCLAGRAVMGAQHPTFGGF